jgi:hypothetical protein
MPIRQYINGARFDFETIRVLGVALEMARCALRSEERGDGNDEIIAKHIIELAQAGERNADRLCDYALAKLREADGRSSQFQSSSEARAAALSQVSLPNDGFLNNPANPIGTGTVRLTAARLSQKLAGHRRRSTAPT